MDNNQIWNEYSAANTNLKVSCLQIATLLVPNGSCLGLETFVSRKLHRVEKNFYFNRSAYKNEHREHEPLQIARQNQKSQTEFSVN